MRVFQQAVNSSPIYPQPGLPTLGPPYMPGQIASGGRITITQAVGAQGALTSGQQAVLAAIPRISTIRTSYGPDTTTLTITTPLSWPAWIASYGPAAWGAYYGYDW
jgi:hypothetical protein